MEHPELNILIGALLPLVLAVAQHRDMTKDQRTLLGTAVALCVGLLTAGLSGQTDPTNIAATVGTVLVTAKVTYSKLWRPIGAAPWIEAKTTRGERDEVSQQPGG